MKNRWLNVVLLLTNRIYQRKQRLIEGAGLKTISNIIILVLLEIILGIVSLPLYITLHSNKVTAFFADRGTYARIAFDYNVRRVITLTGVAVVAILWALKLILIIAVPSVYGPLRLYTVADFRPADILSKQVIENETALQSARVVPSLPAPTLTTVEKETGNYVFSGLSKPNTMVVLWLSGEQTAEYTTTANTKGAWEIEHSQKSFRLNEGNHSVVIFAYDPKLNVKSAPAPEQFFKVTTSPWDSFLRNLDSLANWSVVLVLLLGVFLTLLTI